MTKETATLSDIPTETKAAPIEHGRSCGKVKRSFIGFGNAPRGDLKSADYLTAEYLHGWLEAEHRGNLAGASRFTISAEDFKLALEAAMTADAKGQYTPHGPALAPHLRGK